LHGSLRPHGIGPSGRILAEAELRQLLDTRADGTRARNLTAIASLGFEVQLDSANLSQLREALAAGLPPIVFVDTGPLDYWKIDCAHVAVVVGMDDTSVYLNDPFYDTAPQQTSLTSFLQGWARNDHLANIVRPRFFPVYFPADSVADSPCPVRPFFAGGQRSRSPGLCN
jgi:ABC-type bacteriocin/lantibiotic exporter with double-glycine peptidase domain